MKNLKLMQNPLSLFEKLGLTAFISGYYMNITEAFKLTNWNTYLTVTMSICGLVYLVMRIYHQFLITKREKQEQSRNKII